MWSKHPKKCFQMTHRLLHAQQPGVTVLGTAEGRQEQQASLGGAYHLCSVMGLQVSYQVTLTMILTNYLQYRKDGISDALSLQFGVQLTSL